MRFIFLCISPCLQLRTCTSCCWKRVNDVEKHKHSLRSLDQFRRLRFEISRLRLRFLAGWLSCHIRGRLQARKVAKETPQWKIDRIFEEVFQLSLRAHILLCMHVCIQLWISTLFAESVSLPRHAGRPSRKKIRTCSAEKWWTHLHACIQISEQTYAYTQACKQMHAHTHARTNSEYPMHVYVLHHISVMK